MKKFILTILCNAVLLMTLCLPAEARMTIGLISTVPLSGVTQGNIDQLSKELSQLAGEPVKVRRFENDAALTNWLLRFQEVDAAIVPPSFITQHPPGALNRISDLHAQQPSLTPLALVVRSNLANNKTEQIKKAFLDLGTSKDGRKALSQIGLAGTTLPEKALSQKRLAPEPPAQIVKKQPTPVPQKKPTPIAKVKPAAASQLPVQTKVKKKPATVAPAMAPEPAPEKSQPVKSIKVESPAVKAPSAAPVDKQVAPAGKKVAPVVKDQPASEAQPSVTTAPEPQPTPGKEKVKAEEQAAKPATNKRMTLFIVLVIFAAIIFKTALFVLRWKKKKASSFRQEETPTMDTNFHREEPEVQQSAPAEPLKQEEDVIIEEGRLGPGKVPQLLKRCADLPRPVVLRITKGSCEKLVYFAGGQVSGALTQHSTIEESGVRWNKLGNLLVREALITAEERDRGMALLAKEPGLRFGEALLKLGLIDLAGLRHALTRQAKVTIYSLILYPEGRYQIYAGEGSLPPEESITLEITALIREASHHQTEWAAIRQSLPNLNTSLGFCPDGRTKLEKVSLSPQQEETLTRIDGNRTINEICVESSMMDYEVYRFLYLMVKAEVLK
ncbi:hypothetical protein P9J64_07905 [Deltaproteobacteria bacterium IMCC39524]|nr:hypothetical protein [Deltaproteobacteria bacterium IMCC39524]